MSSEKGKKVSKRSFTAVNISSPTIIKEKSQNVKTDSTGSWVLWYKDSDNVWVNDSANRMRRSPTHSAVINSKASLTSGEGFMFTKGKDSFKIEDLPDEGLKKWAASVNNRNQSLHDIFRLCAKDYIFSGNTTPQYVRTGDVVSYFYSDITKFRIGKQRKKAWLSSFWQEIKLSNSSTSQHEIVSIDLWDNNKQTRQKKFIHHLKRVEPAFDWYGVPDSISVYTWADVEYKSATFNDDKLTNGMFPSVYIGIKGDAPDGMTSQEYAKAIVEKFTGEGQGSKVLVELLDGDNATEIHEFKSDRDGEFKDLSDLAKSFIISGHRWYPELAGVQTSGGMTESNQMLRNQYNMAMNNVVRPDYQRPLLDLFDTMIEMAGFGEWKLSIINKPPVGYEDRIDPHTVLNVQELRAELGFEPFGDEAIDKSIREKVTTVKKDGN